MRAVETIVQTNAPGTVLPILREELEDFETEATRFLAGGYEEEAVFQGYRLKQGVYGQRQANVQMTRVKLPFGGVTPAQMDAFGELAERHAPLRKGHITTRQNFQFHHIPLARMPTCCGCWRARGSRRARPVATPCATSPPTRGRA